MPARDTRLQVDISATDRASSVVDDVAAKVDGLEGEHKVDITADDDASDALAGIREKLEQLNDADKVIAIKGEMSGLEREVRQAERRLRDLKSLDGDQIRVIVEARDNATKKLEAIQTELRQLDGDTARVNVDVGGGSAPDGVGGYGGLGGAMGVGALTAGLTAAGEQAVNTSLLVQAIADRTGAPLEQVSRLVAVFQDSGVEASDLFDMVLNVNGVLREQPELAEKLGIKITDNTTLVDLFLAAVAAVDSKFTDVGESAVVASQLFGEEGVRQVGAVKATVGDLQTAMDGVAATRVINPEDVEEARELNREMAELRGHMEAIGLAVIKPLNSTLGGARSYFGAVSDLGRKYYLEHNPDEAPRTDYSNLTPTAIAHGLASGAIPRDAFPEITDEAIAALTAPAPRRATGTTSHVPPGGYQQVTIINPPGTPAATAEQLRRFDQRNGYR